MALSGQRRRLDLGYCQQGRFLITAGVGLDAEAFRRLDPKLKRLVGQLAYYGTFIQTLLEFQPKEVTVDWDGGHFQGLVYLVMVVNCDPSAGTPLRLAPAASPSDGLLDMLIFGARPPFDLPKKLGLAVLGQLVKDPTVLQYRTRSVTVTAPTAVPVELDGDYHTETPVTIGLEPGAVEVKVP
ncbi:MAG: hypothetical protein HY335_10085 [Deinococcus sp.]|nr:hypothetical protein [Deinococcus sp.]